MAWNEVSQKPVILGPNVVGDLTVDQRQGLGGTVAAKPASTIQRVLSESVTILTMWDLSGQQMNRPNVRGGAPHHPLYSPCGTPSILRADPHAKRIDVETQPSQDLRKEETVLLFGVRNTCAGERDAREDQIHDGNSALACLLTMQ